MMSPLQALVVAVALITGMAIATYAATGDGSDYSRSCTSRADELYSRCAPK